MVEIDSITRTFLSKRPVRVALSIPLLFVAVGSTTGCATNLPEPRPAHYWSLWSSEPAQVGSDATYTYVRGWSGHYEKPRNDGRIAEKRAKKQFRNLCKKKAVSVSVTAVLPKPPKGLSLNEAQKISEGLRRAMRKRMKYFFSTRYRKQIDRNGKDLSQTVEEPGWLHFGVSSLDKEKLVDDLSKTCPGPEDGGAFIAIDQDKYLFTFRPPLYFEEGGKLNPFNVSKSKGCSYKGPWFFVPKSVHEHGWGTAAQSPDFRNEAVTTCHVWHPDEIQSSTRSECRQFAYSHGAGLQHDAGDRFVSAYEMRDRLGSEGPPATEQNEDIFLLEPAAPAEPELLRKWYVYLPPKTTKGNPDFDKFIGHRVRVWRKHMREATSVEEAASKNPNVLNYKISLDFSKACKHARNINDLFSN